MVIGEWGNASRVGRGEWGRDDVEDAAEAAVIVSFGKGRETQSAHEETVSPGMLF